MTNAGRTLDPLLEAALTAVTQRTYSSSEYEVIQRIEQRRRELQASTEVLEYIDYGAGDPTASRTRQQMLEGSPRRQTIGRLTTIASKSAKWAGVLFRIIREARPEHCLEMGAAAGISAAYQAAALTLNGSGRLVSLEGGKAIADLATETLRSLDLDGVAHVIHGRFDDTLQPALAARPVDYSFIDGHHDGDATRNYFAQITSVMSRGIVVLDDIEWSPGMRGAWRDVVRAPCVAASIDLGSVGICVIGTAKHPLHCRIADY